MSEPGKKLRFFVFAISSFVILLMVLGAIVIWRGSRDIAPPDVSDLAIEVVEVADVDNARTYVEGAVSDNRWSYQQIDLNEYLKSVRTGEPPEDPIDSADLQRVMEENRRVLGWMQRAAKCDRFVSNSDITVENRWSLLEVNHVFTLMLAMAAHESEQGHHALAVEIHHALCKVASMVQEDDCSLMGNAVGFAWLMKINRETVHVMAKPEVSAGDVRRMIELIPTSEKIRENYVRGLKGSYFWMDRSIDESLATDHGRQLLMQVQDFPSDLDFLEHAFFEYRFHPNRTKLLVAESIRHSIEWMALPYPEAEAAYERFVGDDRRWSDLLKPNSLGARLHADSLYVMMPHRRCRAEFQIEAARVALMLLVYRKEYGDFPRDLNALKDVGMAVIPADPYDGNPIRYDADGMMLYSVGRDGVDDAGEGDDERFDLFGRKTTKTRSRRHRSE